MSTPGRGGGRTTGPRSERKRPSGIRGFVSLLTGSSPSSGTQTSTDGASTPTRGQGSASSAQPRGPSPGPSSGPSTSPRPDPQSQASPTLARRWSPAFLNCLSGPDDIEDRLITFADIRQDAESLQRQAAASARTPSSPWDIPLIDEYLVDNPGIDFLIPSPEGIPPDAEPVRSVTAPLAPRGVSPSTAGDRSPGSPTTQGVNPAKSTTPKTRGQTPHGTPGHDSHGDSRGSKSPQGSRQGRQFAAGGSGGSPPRGSGSSGQGGSPGHGGGGGSHGSGGGHGGGRGGGGGGHNDDVPDVEFVEGDEAYYRDLLGILDTRNIDMIPHLEIEATGVQPTTLKKYYDGLRASRVNSRRNTDAQNTNVSRRRERMTRPVLDPNHPLVNYGHRKWPISEEPEAYIDNVLTYLWSRSTEGGKPWINDTGFMERIRRLVHEFNSFGLPRTVHLRLNHEGQDPNTNPEVINPAYRCDCWTEILGENWYNETDGSLLHRLGPEWLKDGQQLLIHLLRRMVTGMLMSYMKESRDVFRAANNYTSTQAPTLPRLTDDVTAVIDKMVETHGRPSSVESLHNDSLLGQNATLAAELCGLFRDQVLNRVRANRNEKHDRSQPSRRPRLLDDRETFFNTQEIKYLEKYFLREKLANPKFDVVNIPQTFIDEFGKIFTRKAARKDQKYGKKIKDVARFFLTDSGEPEHRRGYRLRTEAIGYYNTLASHLRTGDIQIPDYNVADGRQNDQKLVKMAADFCCSLLDSQYNALIAGERRISDYDARDTAAIIEAFRAEVEDDNTPAAGQETGTTEQATIVSSTGGQAGQPPTQAAPRIPKKKRTKGAGRGRGAGAATGSGAAQAEPERQPDPESQAEFLRVNYGPGSPQQRLNPILEDRVLGAERHLAPPEMTRILSLPPVDRQRPSPPSPGLAFPDVYDQVYQESLGRAQRMNSPTSHAPLLPSSPTRDPIPMDISPPRDLGGWSPPSGGGGDGGGGGPGGGGGGPGDGGPGGGGGGPGGDDVPPPLDEFEVFVFDVMQNFPDLIQLVKRPTKPRVTEFLGQIAMNFPGMERYFHFPDDWLQFGA